MGQEGRPLRVVLDTNVVVSALLFAAGRLVELRRAWVAGRFVPLADKPCTDELIRVLGYPKFQLDETDIRALLADYLPYTELIDTSRSRRRKMPICKDRADQKFIKLAYAGDADALVSGDSDLLALAEETPFPVLRPQALLRTLDLR